MLPSGSETRPPIFIVGCPRSGTTLLSQLLDRHPSLAICFETNFFRLVYLQRKAFGDLSDLSNRRRLIGEYLASNPIRQAGLSTTELAERLSREATSYQAMFTSILKHHADSQGKPRFGEKTPVHALFLETLCEWFPDAVILHIIRDPRAAVASLQHKPWSPDSVVRNARTWLRLNRAARRFRERPGYLEIRYESLVTDPARELRKICSLLGEEYSPSMLVPDENPSGANEDREIARKAVTPVRLGAWRKELTADQVAQIEWALGPQLESFGYTREALPASALTAFSGGVYAAFDFARTSLRRLPAQCYRVWEPTSITKYEYWLFEKAWRRGASRS